MRSQAGGAIAKLLVVMLLLVVAAIAVLFAYGRRQQPLAIGEPHLVTAAGPARGPTVALAPDGQVLVATMVRNTGRLPVRLEGLAVSVAAGEPLVASSIGLGNGRDPTSAAAFTPVALDPGEGIGVVLTYTVDPAFPCASATGEAALAPAVVRFSSYGVASTQALPWSEPVPTATGLTRAACERATA